MTVSSWREGDKVISINNVAPRKVEEAVAIIRDAGKHIMVEVVSEADRLEAQQSQPPSESLSSQPRPSPYVRTSPSPASVRPPGPSGLTQGHNDIRRGQVISPGMGKFYSVCVFASINIIMVPRPGSILHKPK